MTVEKPSCGGPPLSRQETRTIQCHASAMTRKMAQQVFLLAIEYNVDGVPPGGKAVLGALAAPVKHKNKDAAGHRFHEYALRQSGFFGEFSLS